MFTYKNFEIYYSMYIEEKGWVKEKIQVSRNNLQVCFLHIFRTPFLKNTSGRLLLKIKFSPKYYSIQTTFWAIFPFLMTITCIIPCVKSVRIRSYSGLHFPAFGLNAERYCTIFYYT